MNSNRLSAVLGVAFSLLAGTSHGEESGHGPVGFVRLLDAVGVGTGKLEFMIDGKSMRPDDYQLGNMTGGIALKPGNHKMVFRREGVKDGVTQVLVVADDTTILIPFAEQVPATEMKPARWEIRIFKLNQQESEDKPMASFVSVSSEPELKVEMRQADGKWEPVFVKRLGVARTMIKQSRGYMSVRCKEHELSAVSVAAAGNFVSVLYDDENGVLRSKTFQDYKFLSAE